MILCTHLLWLDLQMKVCRYTYIQFFFSNLNNTGALNLRVILRRTLIFTNAQHTDRFSLKQIVQTNISVLLVTNL